MSQDLAVNAVQQVIRSVEELASAWDGSSVDEELSRRLDNVYRDVEDARDHLASALASGGE